MGLQRTASAHTWRRDGSCRLIATSIIGRTGAVRLNLSTTLWPWSQIYLINEVDPRQEAGNGLRLPTEKMIICVTCSRAKQKALELVVRP